MQRRILLIGEVIAVVLASTALGITGGDMWSSTTVTVRILAGITLAIAIPNIFLYLN